MSDPVTHATSRSAAPQDPAMDRLAIHGARGSYPLYDERCRRYGGNTSSYSVETAEGLLLIDAGTGLAQLGNALAQRPTLPPMTLLLTHVHLDHIMGLPSFKPLLRPDADVTILLEPRYAEEWRGALMGLIAKPYWPVDLLQMGACIRFQIVPDGPLERYGVMIHRCAIAHPQGGLSYRLESSAGSWVLATDREHGDPSLDQAFARFARGADILLHDAQYTKEELPTRRGWGHSTWEQSARIAADGGVKSLVLVSHDPGRSDADIDRIVEQARALFPHTSAAREGMTLP